MSKEMKKKYEQDVKKVDEFFEKLIAKKDFTIAHNDYFKEIKKGDDVSDVPALFHENLKTENVI